MKFPHYLQERDPDVEKEITRIVKGRSDRSRTKANHVSKKKEDNIYNRRVERIEMIRVISQ